MLLVFVGSLLYNFWKNRQLASRTGFYFLLFSVSLGSFFVFKLLNLREIEYRYYFYLAPIFIISALQLRTHLRLSHFRILLSFLFITQISGMLLFLIFVKYGENADFLRQLEASSRQTEKVPLYTDNLWNYKHIVLPVYYRMFRSLPVQLEATESNNFSSLSGDHFFILQFKPENYENQKLPETAIIKDQYQFECSRCDTDQIRLIEYKNSAK